MNIFLKHLVDNNSKFIIRNTFTDIVKPTFITDVLISFLDEKLKIHPNNNGDKSI